MNKVEPKYQAFKEELILHDLQYYKNQTREQVVTPYFFKGKCRAYSQKFTEQFPELTFRTGFYGHNEHMWCTLSDGTIIDPTIEQFYEVPWGGDPKLYKLFDEELDEIYLGKCMNCGGEIHGLKKEGRQDICPPEEGEEQSECALQLQDYFNNMNTRN